jgi:hypothetical protein
VIVGTALGSVSVRARTSVQVAQQVRVTGAQPLDKLARARTQLHDGLRISHAHRTPGRTVILPTLQRDDRQLRHRIDDARPRGSVWQPEPIDNTVFTVGHSTHEPATFAGLLVEHDVELLVDVRRYPGSRRVPWTNPGQIESALPIAYFHVPTLGGRRRPVLGSPNGFWQNESFRGYADHMATTEFNVGLDTLLKLACTRRTAVMCAEAPWWRCHRRLLADALVVRGWTVCHIDGRGAADQHHLTKAAVVDDTRITYPPFQAELGPPPA